MINKEKKMEKVQIKTFWQAAAEPIEDREYDPISAEPSLTMQEGYESLDEMIPRIMRGEVKYIPTVYEYGMDDSDNIMDSAVVDHLDDLTDVDVSRDILASAVGSAQGANTSATAEESKHGAEEADSKHGAAEVNSLTTEPARSNSGEQVKE